MCKVTWDIQALLGIRIITNTADDEEYKRHEEKIVSGKRLGTSSRAN